MPFLLLTAALAVAGVGWFGRRLWGWRLAVVIIATQVLGDLITIFLGHFVRGARTVTALRSFWEYASFIINSLVFLLIGLEVRLEGVIHAWKPILIAVAAIFLGRILGVYTLVPFSSLFSMPISLAWQHVLVCGGLRGALSLALALSLDSTFPYRDQILNLTFGVVVVSILVQGLSVNPCSGCCGSRREALRD